jgi:hypothetical protein
MQQNVISHYLLFNEVKIMFGNFSEQMKKSTKPASALLEMNAKALELVSQQQTMFFSGLMSDSVKLLSTLNDQTELKGVMAAQSVYAQSVKDRLTSASKTTYSALNEMREDLTSVVKTNFVDVADKIKPASPAAVKTQTVKPAKTVKPASAKKASEDTVKAPAEAKKEVAPAAKQEKTVQPQATPPVAAKPKTSKAPVKKAVAKKTPAAKKVAAAPAAEKAPAVAKKPTVKKTVAELSPADVKADSSKKA